MTITTLTLPTVTRAQGRVSLPGSKSISNRVLLIAALTDGVTTIDGLLDSDDTQVMLAALRQCGIRVDDTGPDQVQVHGQYPFPVRHGDFFMGNAGTAIRPLTAALAIMGGDFRFSGVPRMHERPIGDLVDALHVLGAKVDYLGTAGYPPLHIGAGRLRAGEPVKIKGNVSSQFLTALLLAGPLFVQETGADLVIDVDGELISSPYVQITLNMMERFGVHVQNFEWQRFVIPADSRYATPGQISVEGDASSASYFMALGALGGGPVRIEGAGAESIQGDIAFADVVEAMGATVVREPAAITVSSPGVASGPKLTAFDLDFNLIPDAAMTAAAMALFADGPCTLRNIGSWRVKETDRIDAMHAELEKLGARVESGPDWLRVFPIDHASGWKSAAIATYDDHRMAMCFSLAAFGPVPVTIMDPDCVSKTFPDYFRVFQELVQ